MVHIAVNWHYFCTSLFGILSLVAIIVNGIIMLAYSYAMIAQYFLFCLFWTLYSVVLFGRQKRIARLLSDLKKLTSNAHNGSHLLRRYTRLHTELLLDIFEADHLFGYCLVDSVY